MSLSDIGRGIKGLKGYWRLNEGVKMDTGGRMKGLKMDTGGRMKGLKWILEEE